MLVTGAIHYRGQLLWNDLLVEAIFYKNFYTGAVTMAVGTGEGGIAPFMINVTFSLCFDKKNNNPD